MSKPQSASKKSFTRLDCNRLDDLKKSNAVKTITGLSPQVAPMPQVTSILSAIEQGDGRAAEELLPLVYEELRHLAAQKLAGERPGQTLDATALVHEAYIRLVDVDQAQHWNSRGHFFAAAAEAMRRILVDRADRSRPPNAAEAGTASTCRTTNRPRWIVTRNCWPWTKCWPNSNNGIPRKRNSSNSATLPG